MGAFSGRGRISRIINITVFSSPRTMLSRVKISAACLCVILILDQCLQNKAFETV